LATKKCFKKLKCINIKGIKLFLNQGGDLTFTIKACEAYTKNAILFCMALPIQKLREIIFHLLYSSDFCALNEDAFPFLMQYHLVTKKSIYKARDVVNQLASHLGEIDQLIRDHATDYQFARIPRVERNLLRLGIFEMIYSKEAPPKVAISEAVRLARKFATVESAQFVNAVLDAIYKRELLKLNFETLSKTSHEI
jgi:transcription antitermination protein NusB